MPRKASLTRLEERGEGVAEEMTFGNVVPDDEETRDVGLRWALGYLSSRRVVYTPLEDIEEWVNSAYNDLDVNILKERVKAWVRLEMKEHNERVAAARA